MTYSYEIPILLFFIDIIVCFLVFSNGNLFITHAIKKYTFFENVYTFTINIGSKM